MMDQSSEAFELWQGQIVARTESALQALLPSPQTLDGMSRLPEAMAYAVLGGGKRIRPILAHAAGAIGSANPEALDAVACAVELIHAYSLVHDDLPCMDNDVLRRGKPTVHVVFGDALAMLVGDALQALAFRALAHAAAAGVAPEVVVAMTLELADAAGVSGMAGGQAIDLAAVGTHLDQAQLQTMHQRKTGAMLKAAVRLGAWCGRVPVADDEQRALDAYSAAVGLAFQVVDDILDVESDPSLLGKTVGKDAAQEKPTFVSLLGLEGARALACDLRAKAHEALKIFGARGQKLSILADLIVSRRS
jgi:farnesyl diphosphate synthase